MTKDLSSPDHDQDEPAPVDTRWGFFRCPCVYESAAYALVSLHKTKVGARRAMREHQFDQWTKLHQDKRTSRWSDAELGFRSQRDRGLKLDGSIRVKIGPITVHQD